MSGDIKKRAPSAPAAFAAVIAAAKAAPAATGATERAAARRERGEVVVLLADASASMADEVTPRRREVFGVHAAATRARKIDILRGALLDARFDSALAFADDVVEIGPALRVPEPAGSTALCRALDAARLRFDPTRVLVLSDGHPNDAAAALAAADRLAARIDVLFIGPESDARGRAFMARLARGGGSARFFQISNGARALSRAINRIGVEKNG